MKGLVNLGNTCYMNSGIQFLINIPEFCNMIFQNHLQSNELDEMKTFIIKYNNQEKGSLKPKFIKKIIEKRSNIFIGFNQEDSWEFIIFLLDFFDNQIKNNVINNTLGIKINSIIKCKIAKCLNTSITENINLFLILPLKKEFTTLNDCYRNYKDREKLDGDNKYYCEKCKKKIIASKRIEVKEWPKNIMIVLKRFEQIGHNVRKNNQKINCPQEWRHGYTLNGGVYHSGSLNGGHYVYFGKKNNQWYLFNDSSVSKLNRSEFEKIKNKAYILHYRK
jgi:ubiquitin C-terminal hydrolase